MWILIYIHQNLNLEVERFICHGLNQNVFKSAKVDFHLAVMFKIYRDFCMHWNKHYFMYLGSRGNQGRSKKNKE